MDTSTFSSLSITPQLREASRLQSFREPGSVQHMWQFINKLADQTNAHSQNINQQNRDIKRLGERNKAGFDLYPFKIYVVPDAFRGGPGPDNWNTIRVRGGYVFNTEVSTGSYVSGSDRMEQYAYANTYGTTGDILLATESANNPIWLWLENQSTTPTSPNWCVRYNNDPTLSSVSNPNPWTSFPTSDAIHIPIALIDAYTSSSQSQLLIRQFVNADIISAGSSTQQSSSLNWNWRGLYTSNPPSQYMANDAVLVQAGTSAGGYVSAVNGNNTNPASGLGWFQVFTNNVYY